MPRSGDLESLIASRDAAVAALRKSVGELQAMEQAAVMRGDQVAARGFRSMSRMKYSRALKLEAEAFALRQAARVEGDPRQVEIPGTDPEAPNPPVRGRRKSHK